MGRYAIILLSLLLVLALPAVVAAQTVTITPATVNPNQAVTIAFTGLPEGANVTITITSTNIVHQAGVDWYNLTGFQMPFSLKTGKLEVTGTNVNQMRAEVEKGGTLVTYTRTGGPNLQLTENRDFNAGTYNINVGGQVANAAENVGVALTFVGDATTVGTGNHNLQFTVRGASTANINVKVWINNALKADQNIAIVQPTPAPTPQPSGNGGGGGPSGPSGPVGPITPAAPTVASVQTATLAVDPTTGALANTYVVESPTETAQLRLPAGTVAQDAEGNPLSSVSINDITSDNVPSVAEGAAFSFAGSAVVGSPAGAQFSPPISLTFQLTPEQIQHIEATGEVPTVQRYNAEMGVWEFIPTTYNLVTGTVTGQVDHFSIFAVFYQPAAPDIPLVTTPVVSVPATTAAQPTEVPAEPAPFPWTYVIIGVVIILLIAGGAYYYTKK